MDYSNQLKKVWKKLQRPEYYFSVDNNSKNPKWDEASIRVLFCFLSEGSRRSISGTFDAIRGCLDDNIYIDECFMPEPLERKILIQNKIPFMLGNQSHKSFDEYDFVFINSSILTEILNVVPMYINSNVPLSLEDRDEKNSPIFILGGASSTEMIGLTGNISNGKSLVDLMYFGAAEDCLNKFIQDCVGKSRKEIFSLVEDRYIDDIFYIKKPHNVKYHRSKHIGIGNKQIQLNGDFTPFSPNVFVAHGCTHQCNTCSFCLEGTLAGYYTESSLSTIEDEIIRYKQLTASSSFTPYSYNLNYFSDFSSLIYLSAKYFESVSLSNERLDVLSDMPDILNVMKSLGIKKIAGAVEGISDRIRNQFLNKKLSREQILNACKNVFNIELSELKLGFILTGRETKDDWDEGIQLIKDIISIRDKSSANTHIKINFTPLVIYSQTQLRYEERITARDSLEHNNTLKYFLDNVMPLGVRVKLNSLGIQTWVEQQIIDLGERLTPILYDLYTKYNITGNSLMLTKTKNAWLDIFKKYNIDPYWNLSGGNPLKSKFPNDFIDFTICGNDWYGRFLQGNYQTPYKRKFSMGSKSIEDIMGVINNKPSKKKFLISVQQLDYNFYSRRSLSHYIMSLFLKHLDVLDFRKLGSNSLSLVSNNNQHCWYKGKWCFEVYFNDYVNIEELKSYLPSINNELTVCKILDIIEYDSSLDKSSYAIYTCINKNITNTQFMKYFYSNKGYVEAVAVGGKTPTFNSVEENQYKYIDSHPYKNGVLVYLVMPLDKSPFSQLAGICGYSYQHACQDFDITCLDVIDSTGYSIFTKKSLKNINSYLVNVKNLVYNNI